MEQLLSAKHVLKQERVMAEHLRCTRPQVAVVYEDTGIFATTALRPVSPPALRTGLWPGCDWNPGRWPKGSPQRALKYGGKGD